MHNPVWLTLLLILIASLASFFIGRVYQTAKIVVAMNNARRQHEASLKRFIDGLGAQVEIVDLNGDLPDVLGGAPTPNVSPFRGLSGFPDPAKVS